MGEPQDKNKTVYLWHSNRFDFINCKENLFHERGWKNYSIKELGQFIHLLFKRASGNIEENPHEAKNDLLDARVYAIIIQILVENLLKKAESRL